MRNYNKFLEAVLDATREAMESNIGIGFNTYEYACTVMDAVAADAETEIKTDDRAVEILGQIGLKKLFAFYEVAKTTYTSVYSVTEQNERDEAQVNILAEPFKFVTEMAGMLGCELVYYAEGYGTDKLNAAEAKILGKFDADEGGEITDADLAVMLDRATLERWTANCKLAKALA